MKLVWSPETASKAYIDTVKSISTMQCEVSHESSLAELISAMAAGWNAKVVVETWSRGGVVETSIGLAVATHHSGGRHICVVPDKESMAEYKDAMVQSGRVADEVIVEGAMEGLEGIDFLVVDCRRDEFARMIRAAKFGERGAVLICKNATSDLSWRGVLRRESRVMRSVFLPIGDGVGIAHVGGTSAGTKRRSRWIKGIDQKSGEEVIFRNL
ncbi:hypothetical protein SASPL_130959 [Salvia splendens]|uniref:Uncharacterized protein n=1 Tax=Salvia splendens TaxID=180675 RepID=A0A8X8X971_SALSN|nr:uncharacterized protein LOC121755214 [Salvia splendens]KAG6407958.1 hypothetical protein SASPL_130959 [Salvia splendens]